MFTEESHGLFSEFNGQRAELSFGLLLEQSIGIGYLIPFEWGPYRSEDNRGGKQKQ
jgi:hypothetical protein